MTGVKEMLPEYPLTVTFEGGGEDGIEVEVLYDEVELACTLEDFDSERVSESESITCVDARGRPVRIRVRNCLVEVLALVEVVPS